MSSLQLNDRIVPYEDFFGVRAQQMPSLVAQKRVPMSVASVMKRRVGVLKVSMPEVIESWWSYYFDTGDAVFYHSNGNIKIVLDAQCLRELTPNVALAHGALFLSEALEASLDAYARADGVELTQKEAEKYISYPLTPKEAKSNHFWKALAREQALLDEYVDAVFLQMEQADTGIEKCMAVSLAMRPEIGAVCLPWTMGGMSSGDKFLGLDGTGDLNGYGRFVGEMQF